MLAVETGHYVLIGISFFLGILCVRKLLSYDIHEQEPFWKMLFVTAVGGGVAVVLALIIYRLHGIRSLPMSLHAFLAVAPTEEIAKLLGFLACYWLIREEINEPTDGIIYMACVAMGFSLIENYFYAAKSDSGYLVFTRLILCTPSHIFYTMYMGLGLYALLKLGAGFRGLIIGFIYAVGLHGLWDWLLFEWGFLGFLCVLAFLKLMWFITLRRMEEVTSVSPFRRSLRMFIQDYPNAKAEKGLKCLNCGSTNDKQTYKKGKIRIQKCNQCPCYVTTKAGLGAIFRFFGSRFYIGSKQRKEYHLPKETGTLFSTLVDNNFVSDWQELAFFYLEPLNETLEKINREKQARALTAWWLPNEKLN